MTLTELANKYGTDKGTVTEPRHGYTEIYERYFADELGRRPRDEVTRVLEIGIQYGASLRMWRDYFPRAQIVGIDNSEAWVKVISERNIQTRCADATDAEMWMEFERELGGTGDMFDLIVDDGSHLSRHIIPAFDGAWPLLKPGGIYIIEDLHQAFELEGGGKAPVFEWLKIISNLQLHEMGSGQTGRVVAGADMEFVHFYKSLVIIKKRI